MDEIKECENGEKPMPPKQVPAMPGSAKPSVPTEPVGGVAPEPTKTSQPNQSELLVLAMNRIAALEAMVKTQTLMTTEGKSNSLRSHAGSAGGSKSSTTAESGVSQGALSEHETPEANPGDAEELDADDIIVIPGRGKAT